MPTHTVPRLRRLAVEVAASHPATRRTRRQECPFTLKREATRRAVLAIYEGRYRAR